MDERRGEIARVAPHLVLEPVKLSAIAAHDEELQIARGPRLPGEQVLARGVEPVVGESVGQLLDDRPLELEVRVMHDEGRVVGGDVRARATLCGS